MILAHGPWYMEWHHFLPWLLAGVPLVGAWVASWFAVLKMKRREDAEDEE